MHILSSCFDPEHQEPEPVKQDQPTDPYNETGLRKTTFSDIYNENGDKPKMVRGRSMDAGTRSRSNSVERTLESPFKRQSISYRSARPSAASGKSNNTWNGPRQQKQRPSITAETYNKPGKKIGPQSPSPKPKTMYDQHGRRVVNSTNSSPTKSPLRQELMKAAEQFNDDAEMLERLKELLRQYGPFDYKKEDIGDFTSAWVSHQTKKNSLTEDPKGFNSPRKDSKPDNNVSKIPAPVFKRSTLNLC